MSSGNVSFLEKIPAKDWQGIVPGWAQGRLTVLITCSACGKHATWSYSRIRPPEAAIKDARTRGWLPGKAPRCRECQKHKPEEPSVSTLTPISPVPDQSDAAKRAKRQVYAALEDYYDDQAKRYRPTHTDQSIARELNVSEAFVKAIREADFGELAEPDEVQQLRAEINTLTSELGKLRGRFDAMCGRNGWRS